MSGQANHNLDLIRRLSEESHMGLLFSYKALKYCEFDYKKVLDYLKSDEFKNSMHIYIK